MPALRTQKPQKGYAQRKISASRKEALFNDISVERESLVGSVDKIAGNHDKDRRYIATQLHAGSKALITKRKPSLYNAYLHHVAKQGGNGGGREKLPNLSSQAADSNWRANLTTVERLKLIHDLEESKKEQQLKKAVTRKDIGKDFNGTVNKLEPELVSLSQRTGSEYLVFFLRGGNLDSFDSQIYATPRAAEACAQLFAQTPEGMGLKLESFCVGGLAGALKSSDAHLNRVKAQKKIRATISEGLTEILLEKGLPPQLHPPMQYATYESLVSKTGVHLVGWPEPSGIVPINELNTAFQLSRLLTALSNGDCHWEILSDEEWKARQDAYQKSIDDGLIKKRRTRKDKGVSRKGKKKVLSPETVESDEDMNDGTSAGAAEGADGGAAGEGVGQGQDA